MGGGPARDSLSPTLTAGQEETRPCKLGRQTLLTNRLVISYASTSRRMLTDAKIVDALRVFWKEHRLRSISMSRKATRLNLRHCCKHSLLSFLIRRSDQPIQVEVPSDTKEYMHLQLASEAYESDPIFPPLPTAKFPPKSSLVIHLDTEKPIPEAKWVNTDDIHG